MKSVARQVRPFTLGDAEYGERLSLRQAVDILREQDGGHNKSFELCGLAFTCDELCAVLTHAVQRWPHLEQFYYREKSLSELVRDLVRDYIEPVFRHPHASEPSEDSAGLNCGEQLMLDLAFDLGAHPFPPPAKRRFSFIDLFAGIGGFRLAMQSFGGVCVLVGD